MECYEAYATTVYGAQGDTVDSAHLLLGEHTGAAAAYVAMTRGRSRNVAHLVADDIEEARSQWVATFGRDRADLGPTHAARLAAEDVDRYGTHRPLDRVLADLRRAWSTEQHLHDRLNVVEQWRDQLTPIVALRDELDRVDAAVTADADHLTNALHQAWKADSPTPSGTRTPSARAPDRSACTAARSAEQESGWRHGRRPGDRSCPPSPRIPTR